MAGSTDVVVRFVADSSQLQNETAKIEGTGSKLKSWGKGVGAAIAGAFAVDQIKDWVSAASELEDQLAASQQIFGAAAGTIEKFGDRSADAFGIAKSDALAAANTFATFGKGAGLAGDDLAGFATQMTGLAGDLASFRGTSPEEAITAIGAALRGETEPIRQYGVLLDDATLRNRAMAMGLISTTKEALTPQQKVLAAQAEILAQTGDAQGDFARTSDSAANQQKKMAAQMKDTQAALGQALLPVLQAVLPVLRSLAGVIEQNSGWLIPLVGAIVAIVAAVKLWTIAQAAFNVVMAANPIVLVTLAIAALVAGIIYAYQNFEWFRTAVQTVWEALQTAFNWLKDNWPLLLAILTGPFGIAVKIILDNWDSITSFFSELPGMIGGWLSGLADIIVAPFKTAWEQISDIAGWIGDAISGALDVVKGVWNAIADAWNAISVTIGGQDPLGPFGPSIPEVTLDPPNLPRLAQGGIVTAPTLALIGERGPEAVVPLSSSSMGGNITINVTAGPLGADAPAIQSAVVDALRRYTIRNGPLPRSVVG